MEENLKLYHGPSNNYDDWHWDVMISFQEEYGEFAEVLHMDQIPPKWITEYITTVGIDVTNKSGQDRDSAARKAHDRDLASWKTIGVKMTAKIFNKCLKKSIHDRLTSFDKTRLRKIIKDHDIIDLMKLIKESHTYKGASHQQADGDCIKRA